MILKTKILIPAFLFICICSVSAQTGDWSDANPGQNSDPAQKQIGEIPYEMKGRTEIREPLITFDDCSLWQVRTNNAGADLYRTEEQKVIGNYSGKVVYKTTNRKAGFRVELVKPILLKKEWDCINFWNYGNHWLWENSGESMTHYLLIKDAKGRNITIPFMQEWLWRNMNYKYWFLNHIKFNDSIQRPVTLIGMEFKGGGTVPGKEEQIFLGPLYAYQEVLKPVKTKALPQEMPFPLRKQTILPTNKNQQYTNKVEKKGDFYHFTYQANDASITYQIDPKLPVGGITLLNGNDLKNINSGAKIVFENGETASWKIVSQKLQRDTLFIQYKATTKKITQQFKCYYTIAQKSLVWNIEEQSTTGRVAEIQLGGTSNVENGKLVSIPFLTYNPFANNSYTHDRPDLLYADGLFYFTMFDWYYTNASLYFAGTKGINGGVATYNGGVRYIPLNNGIRNPVREKLFINVSPDVHEVFPTIDNPKSPMRSYQVDRLWAVNGGSNLDTLKNFVTRLRSKGVEKVSIRYHEEFWREGGESFTFRLNPNPQLGVEKIKEHVRFVQNQDWRAGLYSNYMDFAPVNSLWNEDWVRISAKDGGWGPAWCRCYAPKVYIGWEQEARLAPQIHKTFGTNFSYCDVETCISPMDRVDYDYRFPGAGKFRSVIEYVGLTLLNERRAYQAPVYSEGGVHWFYAGLCDGNYSWADGSLPVFPDFQLLKINPLEMDAMANASGYQYIALALAFGNIGMLSDGNDAIKRYAFLQPFQSSYSMVPALDIAYHNGTTFVSSSEAVKTDLIKAPRIRITYESGLQVFVNFSDDNWEVNAVGEIYQLPKHGMLSTLPGKNLLAYSAVNRQSADKNRLDRVFSDDLYYIDTHNESVIGILGGKGTYMFKREKFGWEIIPIENVENIDFNLSLLGFSDIGIDIEAVDKNGNILERINEEPLTGQIRFDHQKEYFKYRICPVISIKKP